MGPLPIEFLAESRTSTTTRDKDEFRLSRGLAGNIQRVRQIARVLFRPMNVERAKYIIWAADMKRAVEFYRGTLEAKILRQSDVISEVEIAGAVIGIHGGGNGKRTWTGLSFQVADVVEGAHEVAAAGGQLLKEPASDSAGEPPHLAMCVDTEGNEFMLVRKRH